MKPTPGIRRRHAPACPSHEGKSCRCGWGYEAGVYDATSRRYLRRTFPTFSEARSWLTDARAGVKRGTLRASEPTTVREAADELIAGMRSGAIRTRSGDPYKPSTIRAYGESLGLHVLDSLGAMRLGDVQRRHVQRLADHLTAEGASPSTVRSAVLPAVRGGRDRVVSPEQASALIAALADERERALWATALYAGLRRGELMALRWQDVDLANGAIHVERAYDPKERAYVAPKSRSGRRRVPIAGALRDELLSLRAGLDTDPAPDALVFGERGRPFDDDALAGRAREAWTAAELEQVTLHEARHTAASLMIAAGVNVKALSEFLGHASITITLDRYGHLLPGSLAESATLLDAYLAPRDARTDARNQESLQIGDS